MVRDSTDSQGLILRVYPTIKHTVTTVQNQVPAMHLPFRVYRMVGNFRESRAIRENRNFVAHVQCERTAF